MRVDAAADGQIARGGTAASDDGRTATVQARRVRPIRSCSTRCLRAGHQPSTDWRGDARAAEIVGPAVTHTLTLPFPRLRSLTHRATAIKPPNALKCPSKAY